MESSSEQAMAEKHEDERSVIDCLDERCAIDYLRELMLIIEGTVYDYDEHSGGHGWRAQKADEKKRLEGVRCLRKDMEKQYGLERKDHSKVLSDIAATKTRKVYTSKDGKFQRVSYV